MSFIFQIFIVVGDLCKQEDCVSVVDRTLEHFGRIDVLVILAMKIIIFWQQIFFSGQIQVKPQLLGHKLLIACWTDNLPQFQRLSPERTKTHFFFTEFSFAKATICISFSLQISDVVQSVSLRCVP